MVKRMLSSVNDQNLTSGGLLHRATSIIQSYLSQCTDVAVAAHAQVEQINMQYSLAIMAFSVNISEHASHERVRDAGVEALSSASTM